MEIYKVLEEIMNERSMSIADIARCSSLPDSTVRGIIVRKQKSTALEVAFKIADGLGVSLERLNGMPEPSTIKKAPALSAEALKIANDYEVLDEHGKKMVDMVIEEETARMNVKTALAAAPKNKIIPLYLTPAAAGYASPALGDDYEEYTVPMDSKADFACRISGDSMEPVIPDGSVVLVKRQIDLEAGDVGLFYVDGDMKCKQYCEDHMGNIYLFSLNRKRADADVTVLASSGTTVFCFGKVILDKRPPLPRI